MKKFDELPEIRARPLPRSDDPFDPMAPTLFIHSSLESPIYKFNMKSSEGPVISVWLNDDNEAKRILLNEEGIWRKGPQTYEPFHSLVPRHLIGLEGEYHTKMRARAQGALGDALAEGRIPGKLMGERLIQGIQSLLAAPKPSTIPMSWMGNIGTLNGAKVFVTTQLDKMLRSTALDIVSTAVFGQRWNVMDDYSSTNVKADTLAKVMAELHWRVADFAERKWRYDARQEPAGPLLDVLDAFVLDQIEQSRARVAKSQENTCMLDSWTRDDTLTTEEVRNLCMTFLTMGSENVSTGLSWCAVCLAQDQKAQDEARKSKDALTNAFHEAVRLFPSVPVLTRMALTDTELCGYQIPRCTEVVVNIYAIHRNPAVWGENAQEFLPSRCPFVSTNGPPDAFPFGGGARSCIGRPLTMHELHNVVLPLFQNFRLVAVKPGKNPGEYEEDTETKVTPHNFVSLRIGRHMIAFVPFTGGAKL